MRSTAVRFLLLTLLTIATVQRAATQPRPLLPPHVVIVVLDDMGFADLGSFGSEIHTPSIDALAQTGLRFTNFQTTGLCSPSRAALLTGRNHHTVGVRMITNFASEAENNRGRITPAAATLPEMLRENGHSTLGTRAGRSRRRRTDVHAAARRRGVAGAGGGAWFRLARARRAHRTADKRVGAHRKARNGRAGSAIP